ncbi:MAG: HEAT repeat domain-containing protein [Acidobacteria bacterium]|nr:HEAT repeat domain-containing protein [Acidobacteriota bacterium]
MTAALLVPGGWIGADVRPLTLYQKVARATLVARVRATSDSTRRPTLEVLEVYKGFYPGRFLSVVPYFQDNSNPKPWLHREVFRKGEESVLFLTPYDEDKDLAFDEPGTAPGEEGGEGRLFSILNADQGKVAIPSEGAEALTQTVRRIVEILALGQSDLQAEALRGLLRERNPILVEAGLEQVSLYDLAREEDGAALLALLASPRDDFRESAVRILGQIATAARAGKQDLRDRTEMFSRVVERVSGDAAPSVRREAVRALAAIGGEGAAAVLDRVRAQDADQRVRYEAGVALLRLAPDPAPRP